MKIGIRHKKEKCPKCGSRKLLTIGLDQMCCACDWDNSLLLVSLGQLDNRFAAARQQFGTDQGFEALDPDGDGENHEYEETIQSESAQIKRRIA